MSRGWSKVLVSMPAKAPARARRRSRWDTVGGTDGAEEEDGSDMAEGGVVHTGRRRERTLRRKLLVGVI